VVTAIRLQCTVEELGFRRFASAERHLKPPKRWSGCSAASARASSASAEIVDRCSFSLDQLTYQYPVEYEGGETPMQKLERLTWEGRSRPLSQGHSRQGRQNLRHEFDLIGRKKIAPYFLTVHEIVSRRARWASSARARFGRQLSRLLLPRRHLGESEGSQSPVRTLPVQRA
jgi:error-prone DNA polymerase